MVAFLYFDCDCHCHCGRLGFGRAKLLIFIKDELCILSREMCNGGNMIPTPNASQKIAIQMKIPEIVSVLVVAEDVISTLVVMDLP